MGSKSRLIKDIVPILYMARSEGQTFVEPFCGTAIIAQNMEGPVIASDLNRYVIALLKAVQRGWTPPDNISEQQYTYYKELYKKLKDDRQKTCSLVDAMIGFVGIGCSYGGKFWGGYARGKNSRGEPRNYADEQKRNLEKRKEKLGHINLLCEDYRLLKIPPNSLIYADPPYNSSTQYRSKFNHEEFWAWCFSKKDEGHTVFVSEYRAPPSNEIRCVWSKKITSSLTKNTGSKYGVEKLFRLGDYL